MEFGLTLGDHDLTPQEFKDLARRLGRAAFTPLFLTYYRRIITSEASIEEQRKALADIARWVGVEEERKSDPNANLPVFNIIFGSKGMEAVEVVQEVSDNPPTPVPPPDIPDDLLVDIATVLKEATREEVQLEQPAAVQPPPAGLVLPDAPLQEPERGRVHVRAAPRTSRASLLGATPAETPAVPDGVPEEPHDAVAQQGQVAGDSFDQALRDLDAVLGI